MKKMVLFAFGWWREYPLQKRIVGGIKKRLDYLLSQGSVYLPLGLVLWLFAIDKNPIVAIPLVVLGGMAVIFGLYSMRCEWKFLQAKEKDDKKKQDERDKRQSELFAKLINEIKGLSQALTNNGRR